MLKRVATVAVPVGGARQFAAVPRENVVCAVQPAAAPQIVEAFAAVVQSHIKLVFAPEQRIFAFQISFERPLVVVAVAAPQPAVRHGARCGNVAAERYIAVFGMRFILRINSGGGQLPIVVETMFQLGKCAEFSVRRFVPVRAQIVVAGQTQIRTVGGGRQPEQCRLVFRALDIRAGGNFCLPVFAERFVHHAVRQAVITFVMLPEPFGAFHHGHSTPAHLMRRAQCARYVRRTADSAPAVCQHVKRGLRRTGRLF